MNPPADSRRKPARYLNGKPITAIATDYGGYAATFLLSPRDPRRQPATSPQETQ